MPRGARGQNTRTVYRCRWSGKKGLSPDEVNGRNRLVAVGRRTNLTGNSAPLREVDRPSKRAQETDIQNLPTVTENPSSYGQRGAQLKGCNSSSS